MSSAILGLGTKIQKGDGGTPEAFTTVAEAGTISGPSQSSELVEVTNQDSTAKEYISGIADPGELSFTVNYIPTNATHQAILTDFNDKSVDNYRVVFPDNETENLKSNWVFAAIVSTAEVTASIDGPVQLAVTLKLTGAVTVTTQ